MLTRIHIMGASGSGTSTLGAALSEVLNYTHLDTDDYFWTSKYTVQRPITERKALLEKDITSIDNWILSGAVCRWGDEYIEHFDLVVFLWIPQELRMERLKQRELERYGEEVLTGGSMYEQSKTFLEWAALYDHAGVEVRSKALHEQWMAALSCPVLRIEGDYTVNERVNFVRDYLHIIHTKHNI